MRLGSARRRRDGSSSMTIQENRFFLASQPDAAAGRAHRLAAAAPVSAPAGWRQTAFAVLAAAKLGDYHRRP